jgi:hypothetical protein
MRRHAGARDRRCIRLALADDGAGPDNSARGTANDGCGRWGRFESRYAAESADCSMSALGDRGVRAERGWSGRIRRESWWWASEAEVLRENGGVRCSGGRLGRVVTGRSDMCARSQAHLSRGRSRQDSEDSWDRDEHPWGCEKRQRVRTDIQGTNDRVQITAHDRVDMSAAG